MKKVFVALLSMVLLSACGGESEMDRLDRVEFNEQLGEVVSNIHFFQTEVIMMSEDWDERKKTLADSADDLANEVRELETLIDKVDWEENRYLWTENNYQLQSSLNSLLDNFEEYFDKLSGNPDRTAGEIETYRESLLFEIGLVEQQIAVSQNLSWLSSDYTYSP